MREHAGYRPSFGAQPFLYGVKAIEPRHIECRTEEAAAVFRVGNAACAAFERRKAGKPSRIARPGAIARRAVQETNAFACHGIFVSARKIEHAIGDCADVRGHGHEAVIAVDHDKGFARRNSVHHAPEIADGVAGIEKYLAEKRSEERSVGKESRS